MSEFTSGLVLETRIVDGDATIYDESRSGYDLALAGSYTYGKLAHSGIPTIEDDGGWLAFRSVTDSPRLNFTSQSFTLIIVCKIHNTGDFVGLCGAGSLLDNGYALVADTAADIIALSTFQAGPTSQISSAPLTGLYDRLIMVAATRNGATAKVFINGVDATTVSGVHVNPDTTTGDLYAVSLNTNSLTTFTKNWVYDYAMSDAQIGRFYTKIKNTYI